MVREREEEEEDSTWPGGEEGKERECSNKEEGEMRRGEMGTHSMTHESAFALE